MNNTYYGDAAQQEPKREPAACMSGKPQWSQNSFKGLTLGSATASDVLLPPSEMGIPPGRAIPQDHGRVARAAGDVYASNVEQYYSALYPSLARRVYSACLAETRIAAKY